MLRGLGNAFIVPSHLHFLRSCFLRWVYGISTIVGYILLNPVYTYILDIYDL